MALAGPDAWLLATLASLGRLQVIPLDPVGLYIAIKAHAAAAAAVRRDSLVNDRLLLSGTPRTP